MKSGERQTSRRRVQCKANIKCGHFEKEHTNGRQEKTKKELSAQSFLLLEHSHKIPGKTMVTAIMGSDILYENKIKIIVIKKETNCVVD